MLFLRPVDSFFFCGFQNLDLDTDEWEGNHFSFENNSGRLQVLKHLDFEHFVFSFGTLNMEKKNSFWTFEHVQQGSCSPLFFLLTVAYNYKQMMS